MIKVRSKICIINKHGDISSGDIGESTGELYKDTKKTLVWFDKHFEKQFYETAARTLIVNAVLMNPDDVEPINS